MCYSLSKRISEQQFTTERRQITIFKFTSTKYNIMQIK